MTFAIVVVLPEPLIPANRITKGFFTSRESLISFRKFGGLIRIDSIDSFSSFERSTSLRIFPISFVPRDNFIDWTASYATLFCRRISSSSWKSSSNFSSVSRFLNFEKKPVFSTGVSIVSLRDCSSSSFGFFLVCRSVYPLVSVASLFLFIQFFSFDFSALNIVIRKIRDFSVFGF